MGLLTCLFVICDCSFFRNTTVVAIFFVKQSVLVDGDNISSGLANHGCGCLLISKLVKKHKYNVIGLDLYQLRM
ncbi:hypothetical protein RHGRI_014343 [Rhododendron griersonianum]|uniref:Uncharacterized protein n=1 Tax=Rhododendron griersonianum TaxID=479676 RepID=A0AAV6K9D1_9ERIC|nr:hypothetical protein RHGRI_014343 [Rhododendron griersonianum]